MANATNDKIVSTLNRCHFWQYNVWIFIWESGCHIWQHVHYISQVAIFGNL